MKFIKQNITNKTLYTKHFYAESQRLASKLGAGLASSIVDPTQFQVTEVCSSYEEKSDSLLQMLERGWSRTAVGSAEIEPGNVSIENPELQVINDLAEVSADEPESDIYYYHSDHLGSSSWITDAGGDVNQHLQYLPFGEDYIYQRTNSWNIPYTFSGKEKDQETGYSYFGARYYDSDISVWLSVDPLAGKYPSTSNYLYVDNNPIKYVDPDGRIKNPFKSKQRLQAELYAEKVGGKVQKDGRRKFSVIEVKEGLNNWPSDLQTDGDIASTAEVKVTEFHKVEKGIDVLLDAKVDDNKIYNASNGFFKTLGRDVKNIVKNIDSALEGDHWSFKTRNIVEKASTMMVKSMYSSISWPFRILSWVSSAASIPNNRIKNKNDENNEEKKK